VASTLPPSTKIMWLNATCSMRANVIVLDSHPRSTLPLTNLVMRSAGVTGTQFSLSSGSFEDPLRAKATCWQRSTE
jgi:hypothetical protein